MSSKLLWAAMCAALAGCIYVTAMNDIKISYQYGELNRLNRDIKILEEVIARDRAQMLLRTDPAYMDESLRDYFDALLHANPDKVRGVGDKFPRERKMKLINAIKEEVE